MAVEIPRNKADTAAPPDRTRQRLLSAGRIGGFTLLITGVMVLLYPHDDLVEQVTQLHSGDELSRAYLDNLLDKEPENAALRLARFEADLSDGHLAQADRILRELAAMPDADIRLAAARALPQLRERQLHSQPVGSAGHRAARAALHQALADLATYPLERDEQRALADRAARSGAYPLAMRLYQTFSRQEPDQAAHWIERAAQAGLAHRRYREVAALYLDARQRATQPVAQQMFYRKGIDTLLAGNLPHDALAAAESQLGELAEDPDILLYVIRVARAANRADRAEVYVRKLLHYAALDKPLALNVSALMPVNMVRGDALSSRLPACTPHRHQACWQRLDTRVAPPVRPGLRQVSTQGHGSPQLPFDDAIYRLGYEVFLANRNLHDAYAVAQAAVRQVPERDDWRERLAQVAEWLGKPDIALAQWRHLALTRNNEKAWQAMLRLAPGLFDGASLILALRHEHAAGRLQRPADIARLVQAYETEAEPETALRFLREAYQRQPKRFLLEQEAMLAERMGRTSEAMASLHRLSERHGARADEVRRLAAMQVSQGRWADAFHTLQRHQAVAPNDRKYQALMADLAWRMQEKNAARQLYQTLQRTGTLEDYEAERLIVLLGESSPHAAATAALNTWRTQRSPRFIALALGILAQARDPGAARRLLDSLTAADLHTLEQHSAFLERRADIARLEGQPLKALADLQRARALDPDNVAIQANLLWALIEARQRDALADETARLKTRAVSEPVFWSPMAAALVTLGRPRDALPFYARQAAAKHDDYLWQVGYAQVLDAAGQADFAWRLRRHAWLQLRRAGKPAPGAADVWLAQARLALQLAPGDTGARWLREALRQDRAAHTELSAEARELATAWLLSSEQHEAAKRWLAQQYSTQLMAPRWAEAALALASNDTAALRHIAEGDDDNKDLPADTRAAAALQLREYTLARRLAFDGLREQPDHETLHAQFVESRWAQQNRVSATLRSETLGALEATTLRAEAQHDIRPHLKLGLELVEHRLSTRDTTQLLRPPANDLRLTLSSRLTHGKHESGLKLFVRKALSSIAGLQLDHQLRLDRRVRVGAALGFNLEADETAALKAGGVKDSLKLNADWQISARDYLLAEAAYNRYLGQDRTALGSGLTLALQAGHRLRIAYPDMTIKLLGNIARFDTESLPGGRIAQLLPAGVGAMPGDSTQFGVGLGLGESIFEQPSRAFRPYATLDLLHATDAGWGYSVELGFVVSPTGADWLRGRWRDGRTRFSGEQDAQLFELEYRYLF